MESDSCASGMFPSNRSVTWRSLPSPGFPRDKFPCFDGTMERSDLLRPSHRARLPSPGDTMRCARLVRSQRPRHETAGLGLVIRAPRTGTYRMETTRISQVPGESSCAFALLYDHGRTDPSG